jgi:putative transposase
MHPEAMLGFVDGSCLQNRPNAARMLATPVWKYQQPGRRCQPFFGFMPLQGRPCIQAVAKADAWAMEEFLCLIRKENNDDKPIGLVLDNARIHHARLVKQKARELDIHLLFLPPYSPKYNPIEFLWKDGKRKLSAIANFEQAKQRATEIFLELIRQRAASYAKAWCEHFV